MIFFIENKRNTLSCTKSNLTTTEIVNYNSQDNSNRQRISCANLLLPKYSTTETSVEKSTTISISKCKLKSRRNQRETHCVYFQSRFHRRSPGYTSFHSRLFRSRLRCPTMSSSSNQGSYPLSLILVGECISLHSRRFSSRTHLCVIPAKRSLNTQPTTNSRHSKRLRMELKKHTNTAT